MTRTHPRVDLRGTSSEQADEPALDRQPRDLQTEDGAGDRDGVLAGLGPAGPWIVAGVVAVVAVFAAVQWFRLDRAAQRDAAIEAVVGETISTLTNWQAGNLDQVRTDLEALTTPGFRDQATGLIDDVSQGLRQVQAESTGEVLDLLGEVQGGTVRDDGSREAPDQPVGVGMALVRQSVTNVGLDRPDVSCWSARAITKKIDGQWLVDDLELYGPNQCPGAGASGGGTATPGDATPGGSTDGGETGGGG